MEFGLFVLDEDSLRAERLVCFLCNLVCVNPVTAIEGDGCPIGHVFCASCHDEAFTPETCEHCLNVGPNSVLKGVIDSCLVHCLNAELGCEETESYSNGKFWIEHGIQCEFKEKKQTLFQEKQVKFMEEFVPCPYLFAGCEISSISRSELIQHLRFEKSLHLRLATAKCLQLKSTADKSTSMRIRENFRSLEAVKREMRKLDELASHYNQSDEDVSIQIDPWRVELKLGDEIDVMDAESVWYVSIVTKRSGGFVHIVRPFVCHSFAHFVWQHYVGWPDKWDEKLPITSSRLAALGTYTKVGSRKKRKSSSNGSAASTPTKQDLTHISENRV
jgi:hypothetical protein